MLDLEHSAEDAALAESVRRYCATRPAGDHGLAWPNGWWRGLADLGVLALATPEGGGGASSVVAAAEALGQANAPGPFVQTLVAAQLLDEAGRASLIGGEAVAAVGDGPLVPWLPVATVIVSLEGEQAFLARTIGPVETVDTLAGEPWGRAALEHVAALGPSGPALALGNCALGAYLAAVGQQLLDTTAAYANDRMQFRTSIGTFQAVAHPLATCALHLHAARSLARIAADALDRGAPDAASRAATARLSATKAALALAFQAHQTFGAMGFTVEGPVAAVTARVRQLSLLAPRPDQLRAAVLAHH